MQRIDLHGQLSLLIPVKEHSGAELDGIFRVTISKSSPSRL